MSVDALLRDSHRALTDAGLRGSILVRDFASGEEIGIEPELEFAVASLVKVPLAVATLERIRLGELDGSTAIPVQPGRVLTPGPTGLTKFRHPAVVAIDDLLYLTMAFSDNVAGDALFRLTPPEQVARIVRDFGIRGITVRHPVGLLTETAAERFDPEDAHLAHSLAIDSGTTGRGHRVSQLDVSRANSGSARAYIDLLQALWTPSAIDGDVSARVRSLMGDNMLRQRLAPDFSSDASRWSSKTGTVLNLRHEVGVVEHSDGQTFGVAVLTESRVAATLQPGAEATMARVARNLRDHLRR